MRYVILIFSVFFLWSCGSKTTVILLPEEDTGQTGKVIVKNETSETLLDKPYTYAHVKSKTRKLTAATTDREDVTRSFDGLLKAQPPKPVHYTLYFKNRTAGLTNDSLKLIPKVIEMAKQREPSQISVIGHADTKGSDAHNIKLSMERAKAVATILEASGVRMKTISVTSHGENELLVPTADNVSEPKNRRVEIMVR